jgi:hypothetical protein
MKWMLLRMVEWHSRSVHGAAFNTWYLGRFIEQWADPRVVQGLRAVLPGYDEAAAREALLATLGLFREMGEETAARLGLSYPREAHEQVERWIRGWFAGAARDT